jgi:hypothetical protein
VSWVTGRDDGALGNDVSGMRSMDGARAREGGSLEGDCETLPNFGSRGSIVGGVVLVRFSAEHGGSNKERHCWY